MNISVMNFAVSRQYQNPPADKWQQSPPRAMTPPTGNGNATGVFQQGVNPNVPQVLLYMIMYVPLEMFEMAWYKLRTEFQANRLPGTVGVEARQHGTADNKPLSCRYRLSAWFGADDQIGIRAFDALAARFETASLRVMEYEVPIYGGRTPAAIAIHNLL